MPLSFTTGIGPAWHAAIITAVTWITCLAAPAAISRGADGDDSSPAEQIAHFEASIRPLFVEHCWKCHGPDGKGGLRLDSRAAALAGGESGPAIEPGTPHASLIVRAVRYTDPAYQMPPSGKLPASAIKAIEHWVAMGAPYPETTTGTVRRGAFSVSETDRDHWAYARVARPAPPTTTTGTPIDAFLDERLAARSITANPRATPRELVRRAWFDLVGLPPPITAIEAFERDPSDSAWEAVIDRLLAMPAYGERWGRHWLDVVRFAQTNGYERDGEKPFAWRYRDWVIAAFNDDMPYDQFVREQIAGDQLEPRADSALVATGFWHLGTWDDEPDDVRLARFDELDDMITTIGQGFLGTTINCARCHDHKFDPLGQKDYYRLLGMVHSIERYSPKYGTEKRKKKDRPAEEETVAIEPKAFARLATGEWALCAVDATQTTRPRVLIRGNPATPGGEVEPGIPEVLDRCVPESQLAGLTGRRRLAAWIASPDNPLTPRVLVNRVWLHHFGRGLVTTPNDFGFTAEPPSHGRLLDWLAAEFVEGGWSVKRLHRMIMRSEAYRRSSRADRPECLAADEGNDLWWRHNRRRLEAEAIRDAFLTAAGTLNPQPGGRGFFASLGGDCLAGQSKPGKDWELSEASDRNRRSVYGFVKRTLLMPELEGFDYTNTTASVGERSVTTVSPQALLLTNGSFAQLQAAAMARRIADEPAPHRGSTDEHFVTRAYEMALSRRPTAAERSIATAYLSRRRSAWSTTPDTMTLRPLVPAALVKEYRDRLGPDQILDASPGTWLVGGGVWGGGYEGILNIDPKTGPFALWLPSRPKAGGDGFTEEGRCTDGTVEAEVLVHGATELAGVLFRAVSEGVGLQQRFTGYELAFVPPLKAVELRKATATGHVVLASTKRELHPDTWLHVRFDCVGGRIAATLDHEPHPVLSADDPAPLARPGHVGLHTWGASLEARNMFARTIGGDPVRIDAADPPDAAEATARAQRDVCLLILNLNEFIYVD